MPRKVRTQKRDRKGRFSYTGKLAVSATLDPDRYGADLSDSDQDTVNQAVQGGSRNPLERHLQTLNGMAHSAICALRRGDTPTPAADDGLRDALAQRSATARWNSAYYDFYQANTYGQEHRDTLRLCEQYFVTERRAEQAQTFVESCGGPLDDLEEHEAGLRMRGAWAQSRRMAGKSNERWVEELNGIYASTFTIEDWNQPISPDGTTVGDLSRNGEYLVLPDEVDTPARNALIAADIRMRYRLGLRSEGLHRAMRRWATAVATPVTEQAPELKQQAAQRIAEFNALNPVEKIGRPAIDAVLAAHDQAVHDGVPLNSEQTETIDWLKDQLGPSDQPANTDQPVMRE